MRAIVVALLLMTHAVWGAEFDPALVDGAHREGTLTWYTGLIVNQAARPLADAFEARFPGVRLSYARASNTETTLKILNESRAGRPTADVFDVTSGIYSLLDAHVVAAYPPRAAANFASNHRQAVRAAVYDIYFFFEFLMKSDADIRLARCDKNDRVGRIIVKRVGNGVVNRLRTNR